MSDPFGVTKMSVRYQYRIEDVCSLAEVCNPERSHLAAVVSVNLEGRFGGFRRYTLTLDFVDERYTTDSRIVLATYMGNAARKVMADARRYADAILCDYRVNDVLGRRCTSADHLSLSEIAELIGGEGD